MPGEISEAEKDLLQILMVDCDRINEIESKTRGQADCEEWKNERKFRLIFTASNFGLIRDRKRNHDTLVISCTQDHLLQDTQTMGANMNLWP